jgi:integrase
MIQKKQTKRRRARGSGCVYQKHAPGCARPTDASGNSRCRCVWWIAYKHPDGRRVAESSESSRKGDAQRLLTKRVGAQAHGLAVIPHAERLSFYEAARAVIDDYKANGKRSLNVVEGRIEKHLMPYFGQHRLAAITSATVTAYVAARQKRGIERERAIPIGDGNTERKLVRVRDVSNADINRDLQVLKRIFSLAAKDGRLAVRPHIALLREDNVRKGFFEADQLANVLAHLPAALKPVIEFGAITGWRINSEVLLLEWRHVDFAGGEIRLDAGSTKNGEGRTFPMTRELRRLLEARHSEHLRLKKAGEIKPWVFFRMVAKGRGGKKEPKPIGEFKKSWKRACLAAGCPGRIPHDLRRTAVRNLVRAGIPERVAMTMTGHKTRSVFERYNIVSSGDLTDAARKLDALPAFATAR